MIDLISPGAFAGRGRTAYVKSIGAMMMMMV
jgi:hypothetical protein